MEFHWERDLRDSDLPASESQALLNDMLSPLDFVIGTYSTMAAGKLNTVFRVRRKVPHPRQANELIVRIHERPPEQVETEWAVLDFVEDRVPVAKTVYRDPHRKFSILERVPGAEIEALLHQQNKPDEVVAAASDLGRVLVEISRFTFSQAGFFDKNLQVVQPWPSAVEGLLSYLFYRLPEARLDPTLRAEVERTVRDAQGRLAEVAGQPCLVHGDYKSSNLMVHQGQLSAVLDWEFAHSGTWLSSLGQLCRHQMPDGFIEGVEAGVLSAGGDLPPDWRRLTAILDLVNLVDFAAKPNAGPRMLSDVKRLIERTVRDTTA